MCYCPALPWQLFRSRNGIIHIGSNDGDNVLTVELKDGGLGDDDRIENGIVTTGGPGIYTRPGISGVVYDSISKTGISNVKVSTNTGISRVTDAAGFYSLNVTEGVYNLTAKFDPMYYVNNTITVSTIGKAVAVQNIEMVEKPKGNIRGGVTRK